MSDNLPLAARKQGRREFLKAGGAITAALLAPAGLAEAPKALSALPALPSNPRTPAAMPTRNLGRTGYRVGIFSLGGQAALEHPNNFDVAVPIVERALDLGVNYIDTSSIYGGPERWSEQYIGKVMARRRNEAFLATKTKERTRDDSMRMIEKSLQLLQTDHVDLWQLHDVGTMTDVNAIFAKGGAMEALLDMQQQKVVRNLGITGHVVSPRRSYCSLFMTQFVLPLGAALGLLGPRVARSPAWEGLRSMRGHVAGSVLSRFSASPPRVETSGVFRYAPPRRQLRGPGWATEPPRPRLRSAGPGFIISCSSPAPPPRSSWDPRAREVAGEPGPSRAGLG